jgi:hypothetical protein
MTEQIINLFDRFFDMLKTSSNIDDLSKMNANDKFELLQSSKRIASSTKEIIPVIAKLNDDQKDELMLKIGEKFFKQFEG